MYKEKNKGKKHGMIIYTRLDNPKEGIIIYNNTHLKCSLIGNKVFVDRKCKGCGVDEIKNYKCAYCGVEI
jgi:hypothetical protein